MAANARITKGAETPSERFERIMQKVIARDRRAAEKRKSRLRPVDSLPQ